MRSISLCLLLLPGLVRAGDIDFDRDIRPILSENCFQCHGPDANTREAGLRLDTREGALEDRKGVKAVVPGNPATSALFHRISTTDPDDIMPPVKSKLSLKPEQIRKLEQWIKAGAPWAEHWAFQPISRPQAPGPGHPIDAFIGRRLKQEGLPFSPEATKETLIRRLTLDLTGLPPTPEEVAAFLADESPDAYEKVVDRLFASPRYGERMAWNWLDAARYADTDGFQGDPTRTMWPWRDWLVQALNDNMPFDQFTVECLAGDLLPDATDRQRLASGFNRNHMYNGEGGRIAEETRIENVFDRTETTSTVWLGLTMTCARCHDHKYDPISQQEYYQLFAFFNNTSESGAGGRGKAPPVMAWQTDEFREQQKQREIQIAELRKTLHAPNPNIDKAQLAWETERLKTLARDDWQFLAFTQLTSIQDTPIKALDDFSFRAGDNENPGKDEYELVGSTEARKISEIRLECLIDETTPAKNVGRDKDGNFVLTTLELFARTRGQDWRKLEIASARADHSQQGFDPNLVINDNDSDGWAVDGHRKREPRTAWFTLKEPATFDVAPELKVVMKFNSKYDYHNLARGRISVAAEVPAEQGLAFEPWQVVGPIPQEGAPNKIFNEKLGPEKHLDLSAKVGGLAWREEKGWKDGTIVPLPDTVGSTYLYRKIHAPSPMLLELSLGSDDGIQVWHNQKVILSKNVARAALADQETLSLNLVTGVNHFLMKIVNTGGIGGFYFKARNAKPDHLDPVIQQTLQIARDQRTEKQQAKLTEYFRTKHAPETAKLKDQIAQLEQKNTSAKKDLPQVMIMDQLPQKSQRKTFVLSRGGYDAKTEVEVTPRPPAKLHAWPQDAPATRLALAHWLMDPANPLTARVTVNRYWQTFFGRGQVPTTEDFGSQGAKPTHPELLDWMATHFIESGWDVKALHRLIVTSRTYRQTSRVTSELLEKDPTNNLLARAPRYRLPSWMLRDQALAVSGLMNPIMGGPSVRPYQPSGIWAEATFGKIRYKPDEGDKLYRRSLYVFWRRIVGPTMFFDSSKRQTCEVKPTRTNTPLHALTTLNETSFFEAARAMAERVMREPEDRRIRYAFQLVVARQPDEVEQGLLAKRLERFRAAYRDDPEAAKRAIAVGASPRDEQFDPVEHAAYTLLCSTLLNLDETLNKE